MQLSTKWELDVDVDEFESRLDDVERQLSQRSARGPLLEKLVELIDQYPGDFLAGHYADWIDSERSRLKDRYTDAFWQTIKLYKARSDYTTALRYARQLVAYDPLSEESHREVMPAVFVARPVGGGGTPVSDVSSHPRRRARR